jgi:serine/threonine protein kinase
VSDEFAPPVQGSALSAHLAERGPFTVEDTLSILGQLLGSVQALHAAGQVHRAIGPATVSLEGTRQVSLASPTPLHTLDGDAPEFCPPELLGLPLVELPADIEACRQVLIGTGRTVDPRRIDVYQLGTLLCRLLTNQSVGAYLRSPKTKAGVPRLLRPLLERALGHNAETRLTNSAEFAAALAAATDPEPVTVLPATPLPETFLPLTADSPHGSASYSALRVADAAPAGTEAPLPFERLGPYRIVKRLGRGGMGDVYLGYEEALQRKVAIKVLPADLARQAELVERFQVEATAIAQLAHPNIVPIYAIGGAAGYHFFAMQYVEGESLDRRLDRLGRLEVAEALSILEQCLGGLEAVHQVGLVHRDLKPANILLDRHSGRALLADFGLVKLPQPHGGWTKTGMILGTVDYLAPEQARGQRVDTWADLYALAQIMHTVGPEKHENEPKVIRPKGLRPSVTAEQPKQTAPPWTAPTAMRWHDLSTHRSGTD